MESFDYSSKFSPGDLGSLVEQFRRSPSEMPTAILAPDLFVLLLQKKLLQAGYSLPDDLSLVGIDNISACDFVHPALTSVDGEYAEVTSAAMLLMEDRIQNPSKISRKIDVSPRLIERESIYTLTTSLESNSTVSSR